MRAPLRGANQRGSGGASGIRFRRAAGIAWDDAMELLGCTNDRYVNAHYCGHGGLPIPWLCSGMGLSIRTRAHGAMVWRNILGTAEWES
jgi:hypothetical protein